MKYSFMSFSCKDLTLREALKLAEENGYGGFEPRINSGHMHGVETSLSAKGRQEVKAVLDESQIKVCCLGTDIKLAGAEKLPQNMDEARRVIELCAELGIPKIRVFGGPIDEGCTRKAAIELVAHALDTLSDEIKDANVDLCLETHDFWCEPAHVSAVMQLCRGKHVGVNWDIMHPVLAAHADIGETFGMLRPYIRHVHMHGGSYAGGLTFFPIGEGVIDHKKAVQELMAIDYQDYISGEWIDWEYPDYLRKELKTMQKYEEEINV